MRFKDITKKANEAIKNHNVAEAAQALMVAEENEKREKLIIRAINRVDQKTKEIESLKHEIKEIQKAAEKAVEKNEDDDYNNLNKLVGNTRFGGCTVYTGMGTCSTYGTGYNPW